MPTPSNRRAHRVAKAPDIDLADANSTELGQPLLRDYLSPSELAVELDVCKKTIDRWGAVGAGPPKTKIGRKTYYSRASVSAWLQQQERSSRAA